MNNSEQYPGWTKNNATNEILGFFPNYNSSFSNATKYMTNVSLFNTGFYINTLYNYGIFFVLNTNIFNASNQTEIKEKYPDLTVELYYVMPNPIEEDIDLVELKAFQGENNITVEGASRVNAEIMK